MSLSSIVDKLQDGVPETIQLLKRGDIKVWVLTGDKQETAVNIGFACRLLSDDMSILEESEIRYGCPLSSQQRFKITKHVVKMQAVRPSKYALSSKKDQENAMEKAFVELATTCQAVICCRVTPKQKALIVQMVKRHKKAISLAIGDGANDVNMIKTADIGVGISGQEGMQAVQCSDYALAQFRYLERLLFVHGRWSYLRICKFLRYFFYKTFAGMMVQIWFAFYTGFTAQPLLEGWFLALYNVFYTSYPVLCMGLFEQDVSAKKSLQFPELYKAGQKDRFFNFRIFCLCFVHGSFVSLANFFITLWAMGDHSGTHVVGDYQSFAMVIATAAIFTVIAEVSLGWVGGARVCTQSPQLPCHPTYEDPSDVPELTGSLFSPPAATKNALTDPLSLFVVLLCVVVNTIPSLTFRFVRSFAGPTTMSEVLQARDMQEKQKAVELTSHIRRNSHLRRSSYAFSHKEGYADLISRGASLRSKGPRIRSQLNGFGGSPKYTPSAYGASEEKKFHLC
uniref:P-type phospholipid transporter n=1 Tax=Podarcis muralis TaxID=64176 RepID=A0A670KFG6_PODMU